MASSSTQPEEGGSTGPDAAAFAAAAFHVLHPLGTLSHAALAALREVPLSQPQVQAGSNKRANNVIKAVRKHLTDEAGRPKPQMVGGMDSAFAEYDVRKWVPAPKGQEGTWAEGDSAFAEFNWQYWLRHMPEDQLEAILDGHGVHKVEVRCAPGCVDPHPGMNGGSLWDIVITRDDDAQVWVHPSQKGPTKWSKRSPKERAAAFAAVRKKGLQKKLEALYEEPHTTKEAAREAAGVAPPPSVPQPKQPPPQNLQLYGPLPPDDPAAARDSAAFAATGGLLRRRGDEWTRED